MSSCNAYNSDTMRDGESSYKEYIDETDKIIEDLYKDWNCKKEEQGESSTAQKLFKIFKVIESSNYQCISIKREEFNELSNNNFTSIQGRNSASNDPKNEENKQQASQIDSKYKSDMNLNQNQTIKKKNKNTKQKINQFESWDDSLENDLSKYDFSTNDPNELISKAVEIYNKFKAKVKDFVENDFEQFQDMIDRELEKLKEKLQDLAEKFVSKRIYDCSLDYEKLLLCLKEAKESCQNSKIDKKFQEITKALLPERKRKDNFIVNKIDHKNGSIKRGKRFDTIWTSLIRRPRLLVGCIKKYPTFDEDTFPKYIFCILISFFRFLKEFFSEDYQKAINAGVDEELNNESDLYTKLLLI